MKLGPFHEIIDSPITMDSPHILELPSDSNFNKIAPKVKTEGKE